MHTLLLTALVLSVLGAAIDLRTGRIPNALTVPALVLFPILHVALAYQAHAGAAWRQGAISVFGGLVCALVPLLLLSKLAIGGGDVKLLAALGAALGPMIGIEAEFYAFLAASVVLPVRLAYQGRFWRGLVSIAASAVNPSARKAAVTEDFMSFLRMGPAIAAGTLVTLVLHWRSI